MATLPQPAIDQVPAVSAAPGAEYPSYTRITVFDLVGPPAANRQHISSNQRTDTIRDRVNRLVEDMNYISTSGPGGGSLFVPRDGSEGMTGDLNLTSTAGERKVKIDSAGIATFEADAAGANEGGLIVKSDGVETFRTRATLTGGNAIATVKATGGAGSQVNVEANAASYAFTPTGATFPQDLTITSGRMNLRSTSNFLLADSSDNVVLSGLATLSLRVADVEKMAFTTTLTVVKQATRFDGTTQLQFYSTSNWISGDGSGFLTANAGSAVVLAVGGTSRASITSTTLDTGVDIRIPNAQKIILSQTVATEYIWANSAAKIEYNSATSHGFFVGASQMFYVNNVRAISYGELRVDGTHHLELGGVTRYIYGGASSTIVVDPTAFDVQVGGNSVFVVRGNDVVVKRASTVSFEDTLGDTVPRSASVERRISPGTLDELVLRNAMGHGAQTPQITLELAGQSFYMRTGASANLAGTDLTLDGTHRVRNLADPLLAQDAATKYYVDHNFVGLPLKTEYATNDPYLSAVTVGDHNCDFTTIQDALTYVSACTRSITRQMAVLVFQRRSGQVYDYTSSGIAVPSYTHVIGVGKPTIRHTVANGTLSMDDHTSLENFRLEATDITNVLLNISGDDYVVVRNVDMIMLAASAGVDEFMVTCASSNHVTFEGCVIDSVNPSAPTVPVGIFYLESADYVTIRDCELRGGRRMLFTYATCDYHTYENLRFIFTLQASSYSHDTINFYGNHHYAENVSLTIDAASTWIGDIIVAASYSTFNHLNITGVVVDTARVYVSGYNNRFCNCRLYYAGFYVTNSFNQFIECNVTLASAQSTYACWELTTAMGASIRDCVATHGTANTPCVRATLNQNADHVNISNCYFSSTGTAASILGAATNDYWNLLSNVVDVATNVNGGVSWYNPNERVI